LFNNTRLTREVILCKELKHRLAKNSQLSLLNTNQQLVECEVGLFDEFILRRTDLEMSTLRDNCVRHLMSIDKDLFNPSRDIRCDIYFNNLLNYPNIDLSTKEIQFLGNGTKSLKPKERLSRKGQQLLKAYLNRVRKEIYEKPIEFVQNHFVKLKEEILQMKYSNNDSSSLLMALKQHTDEFDLSVNNLFAKEFREEMMHSFECIHERIENAKCEQNEEEEKKEEVYDYNLVFEHEEMKSDFEEIRDLIYETSWQIEKTLFQNKTFMFMNSEMLEIFTQTWRERVESMSDKRNERKTNILIIVNNEYIALDPFDLLLR
jgi:hypothetical protein